MDTRKQYQILPVGGKQGSMWYLESNIKNRFEEWVEVARKWQKANPCIPKPRDGNWLREEESMQFFWLWEIELLLCWEWMWILVKRSLLKGTLNGYLINFEMAVGKPGEKSLIDFGLYFQQAGNSPTAGDFCRKG